MLLCLCLGWNNIPTSVTFPRQTRAAMMIMLEKLRKPHRQATILKKQENPNKKIACPKSLHCDKGRQNRMNAIY